MCLRNAHFKVAFFQFIRFFEIISKDLTRAGLCWWEKLVLRVLSLHAVRLLYSKFVTLFVCAHTTHTRQWLSVRVIEYSWTVCVGILPKPFTGTNSKRGREERRARDNVVQFVNDQCWSWLVSRATCLYSSLSNITTPELQGANLQIPAHVISGSKLFVSTQCLPQIRGFGQAMGKCVYVQVC